MYNILYQLTCHENIDFLLIQINNILDFNEKCAVLIHIAKQLNITDDQMASINRIPDVYINTNRVYTKYAKTLTPIISNCIYSYNIEFIYTSFLASNCFFYKKGAYKYMKEYDYGCYAFENRDYSGKFNDCYKYKLSILQNNILPNYSGQHEGVFLKKELIKPLIDSFLNFCKLEKWNEMNDTTEECFLPTGINILFKTLKSGKPICLIRDRMKYLDIGTDSNYSIENTINYLYNLRDNDNVNVNYVLDTLEDNHFYCFKRINRELNNPLLLVWHKFIHLDK